MPPACPWQRLPVPRAGRARRRLRHSERCRARPSPPPALTAPPPERRARAPRQPLPRRSPTLSATTGTDAEAPVLPPDLRSSAPAHPAHELLGFRLTPREAVSGHGVRFKVGEGIHRRGRFNV